MKTKLLLLPLALGATLAFSGCAGDSSSGAPDTSVSPATANRTVRVGINGMVCNFCVTNIDATFRKTLGVRAVYVDLAGSVILLKTDATGGPDDATIRKTVYDAGFEVRDIRRSDEDFAKARDALKVAAKNKPAE